MGASIKDKLRNVWAKQLLLVGSRVQAKEWAAKINYSLLAVCQENQSSHPVPPATQGMECDIDSFETGTEQGGGSSGRRRSMITKGVDTEKG